MFLNKGCGPYWKMYGICRLCQKTERAFICVQRLRNNQLPDLYQSCVEKIERALCNLFTFVHFVAGTKLKNERNLVL